MRKGTKELKQIWVLVLTTVMLVTEMPLTVSAAFVEETTVDAGTESETLPEDTNMESDILTEEEAAKKTEQDTLTEAPVETMEDEDESKEEISETDVSTEAPTESMEDESTSTEEVCTETEETELQLETEETVKELKAASDTDFVIQDGKLTQYNGTEADVAIPEGVVTIGANVFRGNATIRTVTFSTTVTTVERGAFQNSSLQSAILNEGLTTIEYDAFRETPFGKTLDTGKVEPGKLIIPGTVRHIGRGAFGNCAYLGEIEFKNGENETLYIESSILDKVFGDCKNLTRVTFPDRLKAIPDYAFNGCTSLKEADFGNGIEEIGSYAFEACSSLQNIELPATVVTIKKAAFHDCISLKSAGLNEGLKTIGESAFCNTAFGTLSDTGVTEKGRLTIPGTVQSIEIGAFQNCKYLGEIEFENGGTGILQINSTIVNKTFGGCEALSKVVFPDRLKSIPDYAFSSCTGLKEVVFGNALEEIRQGAFENCSGLESIELPPTVVTIKNGAFQGCISLRSADLKEGLRTIEARAFSNAAFGEGKLTIPSTVQSIGEGAFENCKYLEEVLFINGDTQILQMESSLLGMVFGNCINLTRVILPDRLRVVPCYAFRGCTSLSEITFGSIMEEIEYGAFQNCSSLKTVAMPFTVKAIGDSAFQGCVSLVSADLNEGLKTIGAYAFSNAAFGEKAGGTGAAATGTLTIPGTVQSIGKGAFQNCAYLEKVIFANGENEILTIQENAFEATFSNCPELITVILPERIKKLEYLTFYNDQKLAVLFIPEGVTEIQDDAVYNCPNCIIYGIPGSMAETYAKNNSIPFKDKSQLEASLGVQSVRLSPDVISEIGEAAIGKQIWLHAEVLPDTAQNKEVTYQSDNEEVVSVNENGLVTIKGYGKATITVTTVDGAKTATCTVLVSKNEVPAEEKPIINSVLFPKKVAEYSAVYTGEQIRPIMTVAYQYTDDAGKAKTQKLKLNVDYTVRYSNNVNAGEKTARVTISGIGEYTGVITKEFTIQPKSISGVTLSSVGDIVYGEKPAVTVTDGTCELDEGKDYEVVLSTVGVAGLDTPSVLTVKGIGNYTGVSRKGAKFNILRADTDIRPIAAETVRVEFKKLPAKGYTYNGKVHKPAVVVTDIATGKKLSSKEYKVIYTNNINAGEGTAKAWVVGISKNGKGYYGISAPLSFDIRQKDFGKVSASLSGTIPKSGSIDQIRKSIDEAITVKDAKHILSEGEYTVDYGTITSIDDIIIGKKYPVTLMPKEGGNYTAGSQKTVYVKFGQLNLASKTAKVSVRVMDVSQNELELHYNGILLVKGRDYTATVKMDKSQDTCTVKIKAVKGSAYKGSMTIKKVPL